MPSCVVKGCKNSSTYKNKGHGITFHRFPKGNDVWLKDWINIIRKCRGDFEWNPSPSSVICSAHFNKNDLYETKKGRCRVVTYAVPEELLNPSSMHEVQLITEPSTSSGQIMSLLNAQMFTSSSLCLEKPTFNLEAGAKIFSSTDQPTVIKTTAASIDQSSFHKPPISPGSSSNLTLSSRISGISPPGTLYETPRKCNLEDILRRKQERIDSLKKRLRIKNQTIRRLRKRNQFIKEQLKTLNKK